MSRSGYNDCDGWELIKWRGMVASAIRGKRGQQFLKDLLAALDAMPVKALIAHELEQDGEVCAMGALARTRGVDMSKIDPEEPERVAATFNIAECLAQEVAFENDEQCSRDTPVQQGYAGATMGVRQGVGGLSYHLRLVRRADCFSS